MVSSVVSLLLFSSVSVFSGSKRGVMGGSSLMGCSTMGSMGLMGSIGSMGCSLMGSSMIGSSMIGSSMMGCSTMGCSTMGSMGLMGLIGLIGLIGSMGSIGVSLMGSSGAGSSMMGSSSAGSSGMSLKSTPSLRTTVSNCEKGRFTSSRMVASGVKVILFLPSITKRSPVCTFTLSRSLVSITLNVPKPLIFSSFSSFSTSLIRSTNSLTNWTFFFRDRPFFWASRLTKSCFVLTILFPSVL